MPEDLIAVAFIQRCWGVKGEVIAELLSDFPERYQTLKGVVVSGGALELHLTVERASLHGRRLLIKFKEIADRDAADKLRNTYVQVDRRQAFALPQDHFYTYALVGAEVFDQAGQRLGKVEQVWQYPANDVLAVIAEQGRLLIPMIKQVVKAVDLQHGRLTVELLPGMEFEAV